MQSVLAAAPRWKEDGRSPVCACIIEMINYKKSTFAFATIIVTRYGFLFEEVFKHAQNVSSITLAKV